MTVAKPLGLLLTAVLTLGAIAPSAAQTKLDTDKNKTLYTFGYSVAKEWRMLSFTEAEMRVITEAMIESALKRKPRVKTEDWQPKVRQLIIERQRRAQAALIKKQTAVSTALLAKEEKAAGANKTASGIVIKTLKEGTGAAPKATSKVTVHYHGTLGDGTVFDSSVKRGQPATFALNRVIKCWTEALQLMKVGGKSRLVCPANLAYGNRGAGADIPPATALIFEVELLKIE